MTAIDPIAKHGMPSPDAIRNAAEVYGAILADPDEAARLRAARAAHAATQTAGPTSTGETSARRNTRTTDGRKSA